MKRYKYKNIINKVSNVPTGKFEHFKNSLPIYIDDNYRLEAAWKSYGEPKNFKEALWQGLIQPIDENTYKLPSIGYNEETEEYEYLNKGRENETVNKDIRVWDNDVIPFVKELKHGGFIRIFDEEKDCWKYSKNKPLDNELIDFFLSGGPTRYNAGLKCKTGECALFSNGELRNSGYMPRGNAWDLLNVDILYSGYNTNNYPKNFNLLDVIKYNNEASDNFYKNFDSNTLDKDTTYIVNMYYKGSPAQERAYREGRDKMTGTHTGYVTWNPDANRWEVTHNIHGTIHVDPFTLIQGGNKKYGITGIFTPRKKNWFNQLRDILGLGEGGNIEYKEEIELFLNGGKSKPKFEDWYKTLPKDKSNMEDYDLEKAYNDLPFEELELFRTIPEKHLDGRFKKPNHITYSDEGYGWVGSDKIGWIFYPSPRLLKLYPYEEYVEYWNQYEPNSTLNYNGKIYKAQSYKLGDNLGIPRKMGLSEIKDKTSFLGYLHTNGFDVRKYDYDAIWDDEKTRKEFLLKLYDISQGLEKFKNGGAVIPSGSLHAHKNHMELASEGLITPKGIPVISEENGEILLQAEIEREEVIFDKQATTDIEKLYKKFNETDKLSEKDEVAIKAGKILTDIFINNTEDNTGLIEKVAEKNNLEYNK